MGYKLLCLATDGMAGTYCSSFRHSFYKWLAIRSMRKQGPELFSKLLEDYDKFGRGCRCWCLIEYIISNDIPEPPQWDISAIITIACKKADFLLVDKYISYQHHSEKYKILNKAMYTPSKEPWEIADTIARRQLGDGAEDLLPALEFWNNKTKYEEFREGFQKAIASIKNKDKKIKDKEQPHPCNHHFSWIDRAGAVCDVCGKPISGDLTSEDRGKWCQKCGFAVHVNCK